MFKESFKFSCFLWFYFMSMLRFMWDRRGQVLRVKSSGRSWGVTRWVTLLSRATFWCCWSCRLSPTIIAYLTLCSRRAISQPMARLPHNKASFLSFKTLAEMVLTTLWTSLVCFGAWNTPLRLRALCHTYLILSKTKRSNTSWWMWWSWKLLLKLRAINPPNFC